MELPSEARDLATFPLEYYRHLALVVEPVMEQAMGPELVWVLGLAAIAAAFLLALH